MSSIPFLGTININYFTSFHHYFSEIIFPRFVPSLVEPRFNKTKKQPTSTNKMFQTTSNTKCRQIRNQLTKCWSRSNELELWKYFLA